MANSKLNKRSLRWLREAEQKLQEEKFYCPYHCVVLGSWSVMIYNKMKNLWTSRNCVCAHAFDAEFVNKSLAQGLLVWPAGEDIE